MSLKAVVRALLLQNGSVTQLVGDRIFQRLSPQDITSPTIVFSIISRPHDHTMEGSSGYASARVQVNCYGPTAAIADRLGEAVRLTLQGYKGTIGDTDVHHCLLLDDRDGMDPAPGAQGRRLFVNSLDFELAHREARPALQGA